MSQNFFQIFRSQISDLKTDNVDYLKKPPWKKFFFDIFVIHLSSRYEKRCRMLQRLFSLFQGSKNQLCPVSAVFWSPGNHTIWKTALIGDWFMPCPFTGPKMFWASPIFLCETENLFTYCASHKHFVPDKKMICI